MHARNLEIIDNKLDMTHQTNSISALCYHTLKLLKIFNWLPSQTEKTVIRALLTSKLDYGNTLYVGITKQLIRLQMVQISAAILNI